MKIQFLFSTSIALLQASPSLSAGVRYGHLATDFDEFLQKARSNNTYKQCKKSCSRNYKTNTRAFSDCIDDCKYSYEDWDYFPTGGQCSKSCKVDSDCQKGGFNPCGSCGKYEGTEMYHKCYAPKPEFDEDELIDKASALAIEADEKSVDPAKKLFLDSGNTCGRHCHKDSDCLKGGFVECGTCNKVHGTQGYLTCIDTSTPAPTPWNYFPEGGQCSNHCRSDSDCQKGGFNPCGSCGLYQGTEMYHKCYAPQPEFDEDALIDKASALAIEADEKSVDPAKKLFLAHSGNTCGRHCHKDSDCFKGGFVECGTCNKVHGTQGYLTCIDTSTPAPTPWNYFPEGGQCSKHCRSDSDCQKGGFNPCGSCGLYQGTEMYHKCYAPQPE